MKHFIIEVYAGEGCDYTIGCGLRVEPAEANSIEELEDELKKYLIMDPYYYESPEYDEDDEDDEDDDEVDTSNSAVIFDGEFFTGGADKFESVTIHEVVETSSLKLPALKEQKRVKQKERDEKYKLKKELKEYQKLKAKFEK